MELQKKKEDLAGLLSDPQARNTEYLEVSQKHTHVKCESMAVMIRANKW